VPDGDAPRASRGRDGRWLRRSTTLLVLLILAAAAVAYRFDLGGSGAAPPSPVTEPAKVLPPEGLTLPGARAAPVVAAARGPRSVDGSAVRRAVAGLLRSKKLGRHVVMAVSELATGRVVYRHGSGAVAPASTMKLLTTTAALQALGPDHRFATTTVSDAHAHRLWLVGGGDTLLVRDRNSGASYPARADLDTLAARTAKVLHARGRKVVHLRYDTSLFDGPGVDAHWPPSYLTDDVVSRISPLWVDEGRQRTGFAERSADPAAAAALVFVQALQRHHVRVVGKPVLARAPSAAHGGKPVAAVHSAPLAEVVQHVVEVSDNEGAEVLARQVAVATGRPATFEGATAAVRAVLAGLHVSTRGDRMYDGSGLARPDRLRADTLLAVLHAAATHPSPRSAVTGLPVAGFTGSLASRYRTGDPAGPGDVRAKTGTLTGVHGLAGTVTTRDGAVLGFVAVADRVKPVNTLFVRARLDELTAALAGCTCVRP
jgi:D-alanyl-D-alanine carboxypeptidase/D-alanyl-D-alanine-endopeptidase (penicillin-binding protein 4)